MKFTGVPPFDKSTDPELGDVCWGLEGGIWVFTEAGWWRRKESFFQTNTLHRWVFE